MSSVPYIGAKISLISRSEIRYEGVLAEVDPKEATIGLENVMMMGTENRKAANEFVPMNPQVYDYILFRSTDIKDLQVCEAPQTLQPVQPSHAYADPAIVRQQQAAPPQPKLQFGSGRSPVVEATYAQPRQAPQGLKFGNGPSFTPSAVPAVAPPNYSAVAPPAQTLNVQQAPVAPPRTQHPELASNIVSLTPKADQKTAAPKAVEPTKVMTYSTGTKKQEFVEDKGQFPAPPVPKGSYASIAGHGATSTGQTAKVSLERPGKFRAPAQPTAQFEKQFSMTGSTQSAQGKLSEAQEEVFRQLAGGQFYEKSSFFDNISCEAKDGKDGLKNERNWNMETFGMAAPPNSGYGGYRGGRGGYRGGNRGGYQHRGGHGNYRGGRGGYQQSRGGHGHKHEGQ